VKHIGSGPAPFGAGFHPYFTVGTPSIDEAEALLPGARLVEFGADLLPTGRVVEFESPDSAGSLTPNAASEWDYRAWKPVGSKRFNHCYTALKRDADGLARASLRDPRTGRALTLWMDAAFEYLVVYTGDTIPAPDARRALAIEPMSCGTDAFNHPEWGLRVLAPKQAFEGSFGVGERP
jgi:aldose 1-epimerase